MVSRNVIQCYIGWGGGQKFPIFALYNMCTTPLSVTSSVNSRLKVLGDTYLGGEFHAFFNVFHVLCVFLGRFWILGGVKSPQEIAGNNTV